MNCSRLATATCVTLVAAVLAACGREPSPPPPESIATPDAPSATFESFGDYIVHFSAQLTTMVTPEVAQQLGIERAEDRAMLNISVIDRSGDPVPVPAEIEVRASNLTGQLKEMRFRELRDGDSIYYLGELTVANEEVINFDISVRPEGLGEAHEFRFQHQFFLN